MAKPDVAAWVAQLTEIRGVLPSATNLISTFVARMEAAVAAALANGATEQELEPVRAELEAVKPEVAALAAAVAAHPGEPTPPRR